MESLIADYFDKLVDPLINPQKRVFIGYLVASIIAAIVLSYFLSGSKVRVTLSTFFARRVCGGREHLRVFRGRESAQKNTWPNNNFMAE